MTPEEPASKTKVLVSASTAKWYDNKSLIIVLLTLFPPAGIPLTWLSSWGTNEKILATVVGSLSILVPFAVFSGMTTDSGSTVVSQGSPSGAEQQDQNLALEAERMRAESEYRQNLMDNYTRRVENNQKFLASLATGENQFRGSSNEQLVIISPDGQFLGVVVENGQYCSEYDSDCIRNVHGSYGSEHASKSIFNRFSNYGSTTGRHSVCNTNIPYDQTPALFLKSGNQIEFYSPIGPDAEGLGAELYFAACSN